MIWFGVMGSIFVLLLLIALSPLRIELLFKKDGTNDWLSLKFWLGFIPLFYLRIPSLRQRWSIALKDLMISLRTGDSLATEQIIKIRRPFKIVTEMYKNITPNLARLLIRLIPHLVNEVARFMKKVRCQQWEWNTHVGGPDPALTGLLTGSLWNLKYYLYRRLIVNTAGMPAAPVISVVPDFHEPRLELEFHCIFTFRGGHIITAACRMWWLTLRSLVRG